MSKPELPRRIWVFEDEVGGIPRSGIWIDEQSECPDGSPEYTRADIAAAMVAAEREACAALVERIVAEAKKSMTPAQILLSRDEPKAVAEALTAIAAAIRNRGKS
jgi:hypothetical protein